MTYDHIIVGAGIAGLYCAIRWKTHAPDASVLVLEASERLGGRALSVHYEGVQIPLGAGIVREGDAATLAAIGKLTWQAGKSTNYPQAIKLWTSRFSRHKAQIRELGGLTCSEFGSMFVPEYTMAEIVEGFGGYTDFLNADVEETFLHYGLEAWGGKYALPKWDQFVEQLHESALKAGVTFLLSTRVQRITLKSGGVTIAANFGHTFEGQGVILAVTRNALRDIAITGDSRAERYVARILQDICGQPFLRVYLKLKDLSDFPESLPAFHPCGKVFVLRREPTPIVCAAYCDNDAARNLARLFSDEHKLIDILCGLLAIPSNGVSVVAFHYWETGTHYYIPGAGERTRALRHIHPRAAIAGEMISCNQGWVEGALESVNAIFDS